LKPRRDYAAQACKPLAALAKNGRITGALFIPEGEALTQN
jgi:hypothetical protein